MELGPIFNKIRTTAFSCITLISLIWLVLLSIEIFLRWTETDLTQRSLTVILVLVNTITVIMLPALLLTHFRAWLDAARMMGLMMGHFGVAISWSVANAKFVCPHDTPDDDGVCELIDIYILLGSWVIPILLLAYSTCLGVAVYRHRQSQAPLEKKERFDIEEANAPEVSITQPPPQDDQRSTNRSSASIYPPTEELSDHHMSLRSASRPSWPVTDPSASRLAVSVATVDRVKDPEMCSDTVSKKSRSSARLSKRLPDMYI